jgi:photosystem II stability/assembly factor-like uncharacterized protein/DNA-binding FrmR family transcriptional regulator
MSLPARCLGVALLLTLATLPAAGADDKPAADPAFGSLKYRLIGPFRGGRSATVTGVPGKPTLFYFGSTGGGVWRTIDGGATWENISDGFFGGSIGAVAVAESDPNVIFVGEGEKTVRGNVSSGLKGVWKSTDAGKTWKNVGLADTRHVPRIRIHPKNPDVVYVAALGHLYGPSAERGVFRSTDGGATWKKVLFVNDEAGAIDLVLDPNNPRIVYASTWRVKRSPYSLESGGPGSGLWKSTDGGDTWTALLQSSEKPKGDEQPKPDPKAPGKGLPKGVVGIIGVSVSPVDSDRVWALVEAEDGGLFHSDDAGQTWTRTSDDRNLLQRAWYYTRVYADTKNKDVVWVVNVGLMRSADGGKKFAPVRTPHGDHHDLWIDPADPARMIVGDDGGAQVTFNGGARWSTYHNQPTAQFYRVITDNHFPYRIYGAQQDNSTVRILSRSDEGSIGERDWEESAGGESGWMAPHPKDQDVVFGGSYGGLLVRLNHRTHEVRDVNVWPDNPIGHGAADLKYRFQWNYPIFFSPHDPPTLYCAANVLFKSTDDGQTWQQISPDLTRNDKSKQGPSGGPITKDNTSVEYFCTIFTALESPHEKGVLWCGSDDGLVHVSRDDGKTWDKVTPPDLPEWSQINSMEAHPTEKGGLYLAATRYKLDDFKPYLFKTLDYGKTWTKIVAGIPDDHFTRVVRADPKRPGLLYCGTEYGMYASLDDGASWKSFQLNLPPVPITDLAVKNDDLVVATQGRSFWILDDLTPLHQYRPELLTKGPAHLFTPRTAYRLPGGGGFGGDDDARPPRTEGQNPPAGAVIHFRLKNAPAKGEKMALEIHEAGGALVRRYAPDAERPADKFEPKAGMNRIAWDLRYPPAEGFPGLVLWGGLPAPRAVPGKYQARLIVGKDEQTVDFEVKPDPRSSASHSDLEQQFRFVTELRDKITEVHKTILRIRDVREQITNLRKRLKDKADAKDVLAAADAVEKSLTAVEEALYQTKAKSNQDVLNFPIRLNNKLVGVAGSASIGDARPTEGAIKVKQGLVSETDRELAKFRQVMSDELPKLNEALEKAKVPGVFPEPAAKEKEKK